MLYACLETLYNVKCRGMVGPLLRLCLAVSYWFVCLILLEKFCF